MENGRFAFLSPPSGV